MAISLPFVFAIFPFSLFYYFKIYRPKKQQAADAAEDNYEFEYDDASPWEDEDDTESLDSV